VENNGTFLGQDYEEEGPPECPGCGGYDVTLLELPAYINLDGWIEVVELFACRECGEKWKVVFATDGKDLY
jgi:hypothetical protein